MPSSDDWNYMFCKKVFGHPSMHSFNTPPAKVLDLGCGTGLWVLEAAQQWTVSASPAAHVRTLIIPQSTSFVGFDLQRTQPDLSRASLAVPDAALRIRWVHGNLYVPLSAIVFTRLTSPDCSGRLERLPFDSDTFDFVRISGIGLGVPEDEWQDLFQEVSRIMKPGAVLEIMEEDLLFPCGGTFRPREIRAVVVNEPTSETSFSSSPTAKSPKASHSSLPFPGNRSPTSHTAKSPQRKARPLEKESSGSSITSNSSTPPSMEALLDANERLEKLEFDVVLDPRDHSKLKRAWNNMLDRRFLTSGLLAVLPFYLSAEFVDVQIRTGVNVSLPPNSVYVPDDDKSPSASPALFPSRQRSNTLQSIASVLDQSASRDPPPTPTELLAADSATNYRARSRSVTTSSWASMHLAKTVNLLQGCKEAVWEEYSRFPCDFVTHQSLNITRSEFLVAWSDWENDMRNRMGARRNIPRFASWTPIFPGDDPEWKAWHARKFKWDKKDSDTEADDTSTSTPEEELCRSLRGFIARKPFTTPSE
ncbi:hypothetical protein EIP86_005939 [Pleurotus ostreatoroseus]|nr:hypothetical protein EIP86_005939 [Pleurotus ostreatoroseus]